MATGTEQLSNIHPAFRFVVQVKGTDLGAFTECTLPTIEWDVKEVKEGGLNTYTHQLPGQRKQGRLTLKNGVGIDLLWNWCVSAMAGNFSRQTITIRLLTSQLEALGAWVAHDAYPYKWSGPQLQAGSTAIAIQTIEFACGEITVTPADSARFERMLTSNS